MKIYTIQDCRLLESVDSEGFILPLSSYGENSEWDKFVSEAYLWMEEQYELRTKIKVDRNLLWCWNSISEINHYVLDINAENLNLFVFEVPSEMYKNSILWSNFFDWHYILNYGDNWREYTEVFIDNIKKEKRSGTQGVTTRIKKDWILNRIPILDYQQKIKSRYDRRV